MPRPAHIMLGVILEARYLEARHSASVRMGTCTSWMTAGSWPPSSVRPQPTTVPARPAGSSPVNSSRLYSLSTSR